MPSGNNDWVVFYVLNEILYTEKKTRNKKAETYWDPPFAGLKDLFYFNKK